jgi:hypothetical protein
MMNAQLSPTMKKTRDEKCDEGIGKKAETGGWSPIV